MIKIIKCIWQKNSRRSTALSPFFTHFESTSREFCCSSFALVFENVLKDNPLSLWFDPFCTYLSVVLFNHKRITEPSGK